MKQKIKEWYQCGVWAEAMVRKAVEKGVLTEDDFEDITGHPYSED